MPNIRTRLESYVIRNTGELVDELSDERREELAEILNELEGSGSRTVQALKTTSRRRPPSWATARSGSTRSSRPSASAPPSVNRSFAASSPQGKLC